MAYRLEIENFGEWEMVDWWQTPEEAVSHGEQFYSQNRWRVVERTMTNDGYSYEHYHDPMGVLQVLGTQTLERFQRTRDWMAGAEARRVRRTMAVVPTDEIQVRERLRPLHAGFYAEKVNWKEEGF